eukprot:scaffold80_cov382-Prasinococcus_capsulatus_cf.AAC.9
MRSESVKPSTIAISLASTAAPGVADRLLLESSSCDSAAVSLSPAGGSASAWCPSGSSLAPSSR